jgi:hypothetical protein
VVAKPYLPAVKSGTLHLYLIFKVLRRPNGCVANLFKMLTQESELNPPKYCGG